MKIAVVGKGGVGKTTISGFLARTLAANHYRVLAVDADPDANLASALPLDSARAEEIVPLAKRKAEIKAIVSQEGALPEGLMLLNPDVAAAEASITVSWGGTNRLLVMGWHKGGGQGCYCEENVVLKQLLAKVLTTAEEAVLIDSEAGLEHLSRGTVATADAVIVVIEPGARSIETAFASRKLCADLEIKHVYVVLNGYENDEEVRTMQQLLGDWPLLAAFPRLQEVRDADLAGRIPHLTEGIRELTNHILDTLHAEIGG